MVRILGQEIRERHVKAGIMQIKRCQRTYEKVSKENKTNFLAVRLMLSVYGGRDDNSYK